MVREARCVCDEPECELLVLPASNRRQGEDKGTSYRQDGDTDPVLHGFTCLSKCVQTYSQRLSPCVSDRKQQPAKTIYAVKSETPNGA